MDELRLPDRRSLPGRAAVRVAIQEELGRGPGPLRLTVKGAKWVAATGGVGLVGLFGYLTLGGQSAPIPAPIAPAAGQIEPADGQALHLVTTVEKEGTVLERVESWSIVGPPRRERIVVDHLDPLNLPTEFEVGGAYVTWRFDGQSQTIQRLAATEGPMQVTGSSANWRRLNGIPDGRGVRDGGEVTVDGIRARRYLSPIQRGLRHVLIRDPSARLLIEEIGSPAVGGGQPVVRVTMRAEYLPVESVTLDLRSAHPAARVVASPISPGGDRAAGLEHDLQNDSATSDPAEVARSMPRGSTSFIDTDPNCKVVQERVEYACTLRRLPDPPMLADYAGSVVGLVDRESRVSGGCRGIDRTGARWRCLLGAAAVKDGMVDATLLGRRQLGPASG